MGSYKFIIAGMPAGMQNVGGQLPGPPAFDVGLIVLPNLVIFRGERRRARQRNPVVRVAGGTSPLPFACN
jgi:hypothetical protein